MDTQERKILYYLLLGAFVLGYFIIVFLRSLVRHYRHNQRLHQQLVNIEMITLETERRRILADLHDTMGPLVANTRLYISHIEHATEQSVACGQKAINNTDLLIAKMKEVAFNLLPSALQRQGLLAALHELVEETRANTAGLIITFQHQGNINLTTEMALHLYRIVQEALYNIQKHAQATCCTLTLIQDNSKLQLCISDNGRGITRHNLKGWGLNNIALRVEALNGSLYIDTLANNGTRLIIDVPCNTL